MSEDLKEDLKEWWPFLAGALVFILGLVWAVTASVSAANDARDRCENAEGIYISGGKGGEATCIVGKDIREIDL